MAAQQVGSIGRRKLLRLRYGWNRWEDMRQVVLRQRTEEREGRLDIEQLCRGGCRYFSLLVGMVQTDRPPRPHPQTPQLVGLTWSAVALRHHPNR